MVLGRVGQPKRTGRGTEASTNTRSDASLMPMAEQKGRRDPLSARDSQMEIATAAPPTQICLECTCVWSKARCYSGEADDSSEKQWQAA